MITKRHVTIKYRSELERPVSWVALVGFMGSGKSRIGAELSRKLHLNFIDTDRVIERVSCLRIPDIFELYGENTFRDYESEIVRRSCRLDDAIVSTGGGTVVRPQNREALKKRGPVVLLTASAETTFQRTRRHKRPLLEVGNPIERINDLMAARKGFYEDVASFSVSTDGRPSFEVVEEIIERLYQWKQEQDQHEILKATEEQLNAVHNQPQTQQTTHTQAQSHTQAQNQAQPTATNVHQEPHVQAQNAQTQTTQTPNAEVSNAQAPANSGPQVQQQPSLDAYHHPYFDLMPAPEINAVEQQQAINESKSVDVSNESKPLEQQQLAQATQQQNNVVQVKTQVQAQVKTQVDTNGMNHVETRVHIQQILVEEKSVLNKEQMPEFSDHFLTESAPATDEDLRRLTSAFTPNPEENIEQEARQEHSESSTQPPMENMENSNQEDNTNENLLTKNAQAKEAEEQDSQASPGRDIYAEMIRDLMRDPSA